MTILSSLRGKFLPTIAGVVATALAAEHYKVHYVDPKPFEAICKNLGLKNPESALKVLYYSGTLTPESFWANLKRVKASNHEIVWKNSVRILQSIDESGDFQEGAKSFLGDNLSIIERLFGIKPTINTEVGTKLMIAQTQEVFGRKVGQERDVLKNKNIDNSAEILSSLKDLGFIDSVSPNGGEKIVVIPGASMIGVIARVAYIETLEDQNIIHPTRKIITAGDRPLTSNLDAFDDNKILSTGDALRHKTPFDKIKLILLSKSTTSKESIFQNLLKNLQESYDKNSGQFLELINGAKMSEFSPLNESGGSAYLLFKMNLGSNNYIITHTPKYEDGRRPDTDSTAATFARYYFDNLYKAGADNQLGISSNQPYVLRQGKSFERAIILEAKARNIDPKDVNISFFGFEYNATDAKGPLSEFAATIAEFGKDFFDVHDLNSVMYRTREDVSTEDMPVLGDN